jgi:hypothetical protein
MMVCRTAASDESSTRLLQHCLEAVTRMSRGVMERCAGLLHQTRIPGGCQDLRRLSRSDVQDFCTRRRLYIQGCHTAVIALSRDGVQDD